MSSLSSLQHTIRLPEVVPNQLRQTAAVSRAPGHTAKRALPAGMQVDVSRRHRRRNILLDANKPALNALHERQLPRTHAVTQRADRGVDVRADTRADGSRRAFGEEVLRGAPQSGLAQVDEDGHGH
jgi:hypothetical protein